MFGPLGITGGASGQPEAPFELVERRDGLMAAVATPVRYAGVVSAASTPKNRGHLKLDGECLRPRTNLEFLKRKVYDHRHTIIILVTIIAVAAIVGGLTGASISPVTKNQMAHVRHVVALGTQKAGKWVLANKETVFGTLGGLAAITALYLSRRSRS